MTEQFKQPEVAGHEPQQEISHADLTLLRLLHRLTPEQRLRWNACQCRALKRLRAASRPRFRMKLMTLQNPPWVKPLPEHSGSGVDLSMIRADPRLPTRERIRRAQLYPVYKRRVPATIGETHSYPFMGDDFVTGAP